MFNKKKNQPIRIHSVGEEKKEYSPEDEKQSILNELFNELLSRPDYKKFDYGFNELKSPHIANHGHKPDVPATHYKIVETKLFHYGTDPQTGCSNNERFVVSRIIKMFDGKELNRVYKFGNDILSLDHVPRPDLKRIETEAAKLQVDKKDKAAKNHARCIVLGQEEARRDKVESYLRSQSFNFATSSSTEELERMADRLRETEV